VTGGDAVVLSLGLVDPAPPVEVEVELPVVVPAVDPLLALVEGAPVPEPPLVCVFAEAPPPDAADDPEVVVFADADPEAGALDCLGSEFQWNFSALICERIPRPASTSLRGTTEMRLAGGAGGGNERPCSPARCRRNRLPGCPPQATAISSSSRERAARAHSCQRGI